MISNSGIVVHGNDMRSEHRSDIYDRLDSETGDDNHLMPKTSNLAAIMSNSASIHYPSQHNEDNIDDDNINDDAQEGISTKEEADFTTLDTKTQLSPATKESLKELHKQVVEALKQQLTIEAPTDLVLDF